MYDYALNQHNRDQDLGFLKQVLLGFWSCRNNLVLTNAWRDIWRYRNVFWLIDWLIDKCLVNANVSHGYGSNFLQVLCLIRTLYPIPILLLQLTVKCWLQNFVYIQFQTLFMLIWSWCFFHWNNLKWIFDGLEFL